MTKSYAMSKQEYEILKQLLQVTSSIDTLYRRLYEMELARLTESDDYKKNLDYLKISLEVEDGHYTNRRISLNQCIAILEHLMNDRMPYDSSGNLEAIMNQENANRDIRRIISILGNIVVSDSNHISRMVPEQLIAFLRAVGMPNVEETIFDTVSTQIQMSDVFQNETLKTFLSFVQEVGEDKNNKTFLPELLKVKYDVAFTSKPIEDDLIKNNFAVPKSLILNSKFVSDSLGLDNRIYTILKNGYGVQVSAAQISEMLEINDFDYSDRKKAISMILRQQLMRSGFLLMDDEVIMDMNYNYHEIVDDPKLAAINNQNKISQAMVVQAFQKIKRDRGKFKNSPQ